MASGAGAPVVCAACGHSDTVCIRMRVGGEEITFRRCARCEANAWEGEGGRLSLDRVLELARSGR